MPEPRCPECRAPHAADQRYCLACGARLVALRIPARTPAPAPSPPAVLPAPRTAAVLFLVLLGFGVAVGDAASPRLDATLASAARPDLRIVLPSAPAPARTAAPPAPAPAPRPSPPRDTPPPPAASSPPAPAGPAPPAPKRRPPHAPPAAPPPAPKAPPLRHVWLVSLAEQPYARTLGDRAAMPYLAGELRANGETLGHFHAVGGSGLSNGIAALAGIDPTPDQDAGCPAYADGCVLGRDTFTLPDQLAANGRPWRAYVESIGTPCRHPQLAQPDPWPATARPGDPFATQRDPFAYFHTIIDSPDCAERVVGLDALAGDLADPAKTPAVSYVVPDLCHDGRDQPCGDGALAGPAAADAWLKGVVDPILASRAYADRGLVIITSDHAPGGAPVGALLVSRYVEPGSEVAVRYDSVSLLRALQDAFALRHLGHSGEDRRPRFGAAVWNAWSQDVHRANTGR